MTKRRAKGTQIRLDDLRQFLTDDDDEFASHNTMQDTTSALRRVAH
jgi:hypothetical protein